MKIIRIFLKLIILSSLFFLTTNSSCGVSPEEKAWGGWEVFKDFGTSDQHNSYTGSIYFTSIYAFSDDNVWVGGIKDGASIIYHYAGGNWMEIIPADIGQIDDITFSSINDGWAVGGTEDGDNTGGVLHYNGIVWSLMDSFGPAYSVDANSENDVWFANVSPGCYRYKNGNIEDVGLSGFDIQVEGNFGVLVGYCSRGGTLYIYNGISWVESEQKTGCDSRGGKLFHAVIVDENHAYVAGDMPGGILGWTANPGGGVWYYNGSSWSRIHTYDVNSIDAYSISSVWWGGGGGMDETNGGGMYYWDGEMKQRYEYAEYPDYCPLFGCATIADIHFFELDSGWGCGLEKIYKHN